MIIPIRCFTCNRVLASKYESYIEYVNEKKAKLSAHNKVIDEFVTDLLNSKKKTIEQEAFEKIGISDRYCCKRHIVTHIDLIEKI